MRYGAAAKQYFQSKGLPVSFPKKDSEDYKAIMNIMRSSTAALAASGDATGNSAVSADVALAGAEKKVKRKYTKKTTEAPKPGPPADTPAKPDGTTLIDQPHVSKQAIAEVVEEPEKKPVRRRKPKAIQADGETPQQNLLNANAVDNGSMNIVPAAYPGLEGQIKKVLEVKPEGIPERKELKMKPEIMTSKTTEGKRTDDPRAVAGRAPFSFQAIRHMLRQ